MTRRELRNEKGRVVRESGSVATVFLAAENAVALFRVAPRVDYEQFRADLDHAIDQDPVPRSQAPRTSNLEMS